MLYFIGGLALLALGAAMLVKPRLFFELEKLLIQNGRDSEPSALFLLNTRFGGVMCILAGICGMLVPFLSPS